MSKVIGIDLGTSNSCVAVVEGGKPVVITNAEGDRTTPSVVGFNDDGTRKVGKPAKRQAIAKPKKTVYEIKRFMGCDTSQVKNEIENVTYEVVDNAGKPRVKIDDKLYTPQEISAEILMKMKQTAEDYLGEEVKEAVITVPAYFNDSQIQATKDAGVIAGLEVKRLVKEPTAAALAYGLSDLDKDQKILVFDCGGGTHDVSLLDLSDGVFEVLGVDGDTHLGGSVIDEKVMNWIVDEFVKQEGEDARAIEKDTMAMQRVKDAAEKAKIELSSTTTTEINLPYLFPVDNVPKHFVQTLSRSLFETMISDFVAATMAPVKRVLENKNVSVSEIDEIILVGGSTRIPAIQKAVEDYFGKPANKSVNPDEVVALGAAVQGAVLNHDTSVAGGKEILLLDVTPISLGIETEGHYMTKLIDANTTIPTTKKQVFSTAVDNQTSATIVVLQGERPLASQNKIIGQFNIDGIAPAPRGIPQIEVSYDIDANGILTVKATDKATGKEQHITITASGGLSQEEIDKIKAEAELHKEEDEKKRKEIEEFNNEEGYLYSVEKTMKDDNFSKLLTEDNKKSLNEKVEAGKGYINSRDLDQLKQVNKEIKEIYEPIVQQAYQASAAAGQNGAPQGAAGMDPNMFNQMFNGGAAPNPYAGQDTAQPSNNDDIPEAEEVPFEEVK